MKNLVILLVVVLIAAGAFFALKGPDLTPKESEYLEFKLGAKPDAQMRATEALGTTPEKKIMRPINPVNA